MILPRVRKNLHFLYYPNFVAEEDDPGGLAIVRIDSLPLEEFVCSYGGGTFRVASLEAILIASSFYGSQFAEAYMSKQLTF